MGYISRNLSRICNKLLRENGKGCEDILGKSAINLLSEKYTEVVDTVEKSLATTSEKLQNFQRDELTESEEQKRFTQLIVSVGILLILSLAFLLVLQKVQQNRLKAKMESLRAQIKSAFYFE